MAEIKKYHLTAHKGDYYGAELQQADDPAEIVRDLASRLDTLQHAGAAYSVRTQNDMLILETGAIAILPSEQLRATDKAVAGMYQTVLALGEKMIELSATLTAGIERLHAESATILAAKKTPAKAVTVAKRSPAKARR